MNIKISHYELKVIINAINKLEDPAGDYADLINRLWFLYENTENDKYNSLIIAEGGKHSD